MWNPFSSIWKILSAIGSALKKVFTSKEALAVMQIIMEKVLPEAKPIVASIREFIASPSQATVQDILDVYKKFNVAIDAIADDPISKGDALLHLATTLVDAATGGRFATPLIHSAIELALSGIQAEEK